MKTYHEKYVVAEYNGQANANRDHIGPWEIWTVTFVGNNQVQCQKYRYANVSNTG